MKINTTPKEETITVRLSKSDKILIENNALKYGFINLSEFIRFIGMNVNIKVNV